MNSIRRLVGVCFLVGYAVSGGAAQAATYYVSTGGQDSNPGTQAAPFRTVNRGVRGLVPGDTLLVRGGTYPESLGYGVVPSGTSWSSKVRIAAYPGETVWMKPPSGASRVLELAGDSAGGNSGSQHYIEFDGINMDASLLSRAASGQDANVIKIESNTGYNAHHIRIQNAELIGSTLDLNSGLTTPTIILQATLVTGTQGSNEFRHLTMHHVGGTGTFAYAFYLNGSDNLVEGCEMYDLNGNAISIYNYYIGDAESSRNIIRNNKFHDITRSADNRVQPILVGRGHDNQIYNNVIYNNGGGHSQAYGIEVYHAFDTLIYNNTIYNSGVFGILIDQDGNNTIVRNNIAYGHSSGDYANNGTGTSVDHNVFGANPQFVNAGTGDLQIQATSPAVNSGISLTLVSSDFNGTSRPQGGAFDIGAFEYSIGQSAPAPATGAPAPPTGVRIVQN